MKNPIPIPFFLYYEWEHDHISYTYEFVPKMYGDLIFPNLQWIYILSNLISSRLVEGWGKRLCCIWPIYIGGLLWAMNVVPSPFHQHYKTKLDNQALLVIKTFIGGWNLEVFVGPWNLLARIFSHIQLESINNTLTLYHKAAWTFLMGKTRWSSSMPI